MRKLENLCIPNSPEEKYFEKLISLLDEHFKPVQCSFAERQNVYAATRVQRNQERLSEEETDIALEKIIGIACSHEVRINRRGLLPKEDLFYSQARNSSADMNINQSKPNLSKLATDRRQITRGEPRIVRMDERLERKFIKK
ncbi:hypothetical protein JTB14_002670 [Gonioctena quinquepunctata]|nr:hypothetical protein JTB14_002670 [Gonioctena quinquepunctata]